MKFCKHIRLLLSSDLLISSRNSFARALYAHCVKNFESKHFQRAVKWIELLLDIPNSELVVSKEVSVRNSKYLRLLAICYQSLDLNNEALKYISSSLECESTNSDTLYVAIEILVQLTRYSEAEAMLNKLFTSPKVALDRYYLIKVIFLYSDVYWRANYFRQISLLKLCRGA